MSFLDKYDHRHYVLVLTEKDTNPLSHQPQRIQAYAMGFSRSGDAMAALEALVQKTIEKGERLPRHQITAYAFDPELPLHRHYIAVAESGAIDKSLLDDLVENKAQGLTDRLNFYLEGYCHARRLNIPTLKSFMRNTLALYIRDPRGNSHLPLEEKERQIIDGLRQASTLLDRQTDYEHWRSRLNGMLYHSHPETIETGKTDGSFNAPEKLVLVGWIKEDPHPVKKRPFIAAPENIFLMADDPDRIISWAGTPSPKETSSDGAFIQPIVIKLSFKPSDQTDLCKAVGLAADGLFPVSDPKTFMQQTSPKIDEHKSRNATERIKALVNFWKSPDSALEDTPGPEKLARLEHMTAIWSNPSDLYTDIPEDQQQTFKQWHTAAFNKYLEGPDLVGPMNELIPYIQEKGIYWLLKAPAVAAAEACETPRLLKTAEDAVAAYITGKRSGGIQFEDNVLEAYQDVTAFVQGVRTRLQACADNHRNLQVTGVPFVVLFERGIDQSIDTPLSANLSAYTLLGCISRDPDPKRIKQMHRLANELKDNLYQHKKGPKIYGPFNDSMDL